MRAVGQPKDWVIEPLAAHHDRAHFSCGQPSLDLYLKQQARQDARRHAAAPFVLVEDAAQNNVLGYYTLSSFGVDLGELPLAIARKLPRYPVVPATLLGRLAVDRRCRGQGAGEFLLMDALYRAVKQSTTIASAIVIVDAIDDAAWRFYRHFDLMPFPARRDRLFLSMKTAGKLFS